MERDYKFCCLRIVLSSLLVLLFTTVWLWGCMRKSVYQNKSLSSYGRTELVLNSNLLCSAFTVTLPETLSILYFTIIRSGMERHRVSVMLLPTTQKSCTGSEKNHQITGPNSELEKHYFCVPCGKTSCTYAIPDMDFCSLRLKTAESDRDFSLSNLCWQFSTLTFEKS